MEKKIVKEYVDHGYGFPILLRHVTMIKVRNEWVPQIKLNELATKTALVLAAKDSFLTGNQIKFLRLYFKMTLKEFGVRFNVSHPAVIAWESKKNRPTKMDWSTEKDIRLEVVRFIEGNPMKVGQLFYTLMRKPTSTHEELEVDLAA